jgi:hypothetical protein
MLVDESAPFFDHVKILDDLGTNMQVMMTRVSGCWTGDPFRNVPCDQVFGGWPARDAELTYPVRLLVEDVEFMWPYAVHDEVVVKRDGESVDPETGLGSLLRSPNDLSISIDGVDYPLVHDVKASKAGASASKAAGRRHLLQVLRSEMRLILTVSFLIAFVEYDSRRRRPCTADAEKTAEAQAQRSQLSIRNDSRLQECSAIAACQFAWDMPDLPLTSHVQPDIDDDSVDELVNADDLEERGSF